MTPDYALSQHAALLRIRESAARRDRWISGGIFLIFFALSIAQGLLFGTQGRSTYLLIALVTVFGLSFIMTWARLEVIQGDLALLEVLERGRERRP